MAEKERKPVFAKILIIAGISLIANIAFFVYSLKSNLTGYSVSSLSESFFAAYNGISSMSKIFLVVQWVFLFIALLFGLMSDRRARGKSVEISEIQAIKLKGKSSTDLDTLYTILQQKKKIRLSTISKGFGVSGDVAREWCEILESGSLAVIDYPGVGEPTLKIAD